MPTILDRPIGRRRLSLLLAVSPIALGAPRAEAQEKYQFDYPTPPVFAGIAPPALRRAAPRVERFPLGQVTLLDGPLRDSAQWNLGYLKRLDVDRLLHNFRVNAGIASSAAPLGGWEDPGCELRGHFVGHYLSACAISFAATGDAEMKQRGERLVTAFAECQRRLGQSGYLSAFPSSLFDRLGEGKQVWAPYYTLHKIMAGLLDMYVLAGNRAALEVLLGLAGWVDRWTAARDEAAMQKVLEVEFGGMNDLLYRLADATGDAHWLAVGDRFTKKAVFEPLAGRKDALRGLHMNTHVPQVIGAAARHRLTGDARFGDVADFFWETVTRSRTYATGGSSNKEHWLTEPNHLGFEWEQSPEHQECCCAYNMMKLGADLFAMDPRPEIIDYYERNLLNHRLGTIQPETGHSVYFLSMAPGAYKTVGSEDSSFWCCNGTALEEFSRPASMIYAHDAAGMYVNLFVPSLLEWRARGVRLRQTTHFPAEPRTVLTVEKSDGRRWTMHVRVPGWTTDAATLRVNGEPAGAMAQPGSYVTLTRAWRAGDRVELEMPMPVTVSHFPDRPKTGALLYGPVVLAQQLPRGTLSAELEAKNGPDLKRAPPPVAPAILPADIVSRLKPKDGQPLTFVADVGGHPILFKPVSDSWERFAAYSTFA